MDRRCDAVIAANGGVTRYQRVKITQNCSFFPSFSLITLLLKVGNRNARVLCVLPVLGAHVRTMKACHKKFLSSLPLHGLILIKIALLPFMRRPNIPSTKFKKKFIR